MRLDNIKYLFGLGDDLGHVKDTLKAMEVQRETHKMNIEDIEKGIIDYDTKTARIMSVHTRDDIVMLIFYCQIICARLSNISFILKLILIILGIYLFRDLNIQL